MTTLGKTDKQGTGESDVHVEVHVKTASESEVTVDSGEAKAQGRANAAAASGSGQGTDGDTATAKEGQPIASEGQATPKDELTTLKEELAAERDKYLRLAAEYDNFRKRNLKERETVYNDARADTITKLLPVYDNLERALKMECADEAFYKGVGMTMTQLTEILEGMGVTAIATVGEPFDPARHNAITTIEDASLGEKTIAEECQKGFMLGGKVIRFSSVVVAN
jgi:molecular chaperone GrpE